MAKKRPDPSIDEAYNPFGVRLPTQGRKGAPSKAPKGIEACLKDFIKESGTWIRRHDEVWFLKPAGPLEDPCVTGKHEYALELYKEAIDTLREMVKRAKDAQKMLKKGQAHTEQLLTERKKQAEQPKPQQSPDVQEEGKEPQDAEPEEDQNQEYNSYFGDPRPGDALSPPGEGEAEPAG